MGAATNKLSELSDYYGRLLPLHVEWDKHRNILMKAFSAISSKTSDDTREGEAYLHLAAIEHRVAQLDAIVKRLQITIADVEKIRATASRQIKGLEDQYMLSGAVAPSLELDDSGAVDEDAYENNVTNKAWTNDNGQTTDFWS